MALEKLSLSFPIVDPSLNLFLRLFSGKLNETIDEINSMTALRQPIKSTDIGAAANLRIPSDGHYFDVIGIATIKKISGFLSQPGTVIILHHWLACRYEHDDDNIIIPGQAHLDVAHDDVVTIVEYAANKWVIAAVHSRIDYFARVYNNADISVANNTWQTLTYNTESTHGGGGVWRLSGNPERLAAPKKGGYQISGNATFAPNAVGDRGLRVRLNGSDVIAELLLNAVAGGNTTTINITTFWRMSKDDYVELRAFQNSGGALDVQASGLWTPAFMAARVQEYAA